MFAADICIVEVTTFGHIHVAHGGEVGGAAEDGDILQSRAVVFDSFGGLLFHDHGLDAGNAVGNGGRVVEDQAAGAALSRRPAAPEAGLDEEQVRAQAGDLLLDGGLGPGADGDHDDDRRDADDDAQHRQERADLVLEDRLPGDSHDF